MIAPVTPMDKDGAVRFDLVPRQAELLLSRGAKGFYLCGGTGEGMLLTLPERMQLVDAWVDAIGDRAALLVHVGHVCIEDSKTLARHAAKANVSAISSVTPPVYAARDAATLVQVFHAIASAAPNLPFYYY